VLSGAKGPVYPTISVNPVVQKSGQQMWTVPVIFKPVDCDDEFVMSFGSLRASPAVRAQFFSHTQV
jgi:hypothetical protein